MAEVVMEDTNGLQPPFPPAHHVPVEIWATIFRIFYDSFYDAKNPHGPSSLHPSHPLHVIANVCHTWRDVIESLPILWTKITLKNCWKVPKKGISTYIPTKLHMLSNILRLSRDLPLEIIISAPLNANPSVFLYPFLLYIAEHSHRWTRLIINENEDVLVFGALNSAISLLGLEELPFLESVSVDCSQLMDMETDTIACSEFHSLKLPKLDKLCVAYRCIPNLMPLGDLKEIEFNNVPIPEQWEALRHSKSLSSVEAIFVTGDEREFNPSRSSLWPWPITLHALERLFVRFWDTGGFSVTAPKLRELVIDVSATAGEMQGIISFIERSKCLLAMFTIKAFDVEDPNTQAEIDLANAMTVLLHYLPAVKTLQLGPEENVETLANALSQTKDGRWCNCPSLEHLIVQYYLDCTSESLNILIDMIEKRWQLSRSSGMRGLRKVEGFWRKAEHSDCLRRLEAMAAEGLYVGFRD